jgi:WD40 repeat protein
MAFSSTHPGGTTNKLILTPVKTLEGHEPWEPMLPATRNGHRIDCKSVSYISYFPDDRQMISGSHDQTTRRWDLREGKEIEETRRVYEYDIEAVGVSRNGRWIVTAGGDYSGGLEVSEVATGIVRVSHKGYWISYIDISADSMLLAGGSLNAMAWIWSLDTGNLLAGPFKFGDNYLGTLRFSADSQKLAVLGSRCLQVWDVQAQKLDVQTSAHNNAMHACLPVFWTTKDKSIIAVFRFPANDYDAIYEFDASTLKTVGAPFKAHAGFIRSLAFSSDHVLLASSCFQTINLWAFKSRQLLASFDLKHAIFTLVLSPNSRQLAYTTANDCNIYICNIPANILASIGLAEEQQSSTRKPECSLRAGLLSSDATRPVRGKPVITPVLSPISHSPRPVPTSNSHTFLRFLHKLLSSSSRMDVVRPDEPHNPLDFPATSPLPRPLVKPDENSRPTPAPPCVINTSPTLRSSLHRLSSWWPFQTEHASPVMNVVDVPLAPGKLRYATAGAPGNDDDDLIRDEDYVSPPPSPNPGSRRGIVNAGQHDSGRFCFCF